MAAGPQRPVHPGDGPGRVPGDPVAGHHDQPPAPVVQLLPAVEVGPPARLHLDVLATVVLDDEPDARVAEVEAPDDHTIAKLALAAGARGNVRTETMRAFTDEEARSIAGELSES